VSIITSRNTNNQSFYNANRKSPWYIIAIAMIGTSISGVTFISVPGMVIKDGFSYMQMVFGFLFGYIVVATILLPIFYKMKLTSIYSYLEARFGKESYKTGAAFFLLSRTLGSAFRLYIVAIVLQTAIFDYWNIPFWATALVSVMLIFLYTRRGGMKTVIWTDSIQTIMLVGAMALCIVQVANAMDLSFSGVVKSITESDMSKIFVWDNAQPNTFWKHFLAGIFTVITMTGLDQDQMQKNLSCKNLKDAQKNMFTYGAMFVPINLLFLSLGILLINFAVSQGVNIHNVSGDKLFPMLATGIHPVTEQLYLGVVTSILFILGITSAAYSSADSALTALTTSCTIDIMGIKDDDPKLKRKRSFIHIGLSFLLMLVILIFKLINDDSVINSIYTVAGYTYGPLLGMFAFGICTKMKVRNKLVPIVCLSAPIIIYFLNTFVFNFGFFILLVNGFLTFVGMLMINCKSKIVNLKL
jgi:SSS family transporter